MNFVTISHTRNDKGWKDQMERSGAHGIQIREDKPPYFTKALNIKGYPCFLLYSPEGKLITRKAPRYSSGEEIRKFIKSYLKK